MRCHAYYDFKFKNVDLLSPGSLQTDLDRTLENIISGAPFTNMV